MKIVTPEADGQQAEAPLDAKSQALVADALARLLASTYSLYVKSLFYHWNVTGPQFIGLHALFEEHYQNLHEAGDELAERIRALGHFTPGTLQAFAALSVVKDDERLPEDAKGMIKNLRAAHELCTKEARRVFEIAEDAGDDVTADIVVARRQFHDKAVWMLGASL
ncbi:MAG: DNA starvation/stationary phase protection protein [Alphaproteobacteria bacterium]|nr:MAG: DNA starvation/stationary phase protection protein [Alphaproteobacteria bacterium]